MSCRSARSSASHAYFSSSAISCRTRRLRSNSRSSPRATGSASMFFADITFPSLLGPTAATGEIIDFFEHLFRRHQGVSLIVRHLIPQLVDTRYRAAKAAAPTSIRYTGAALSAKLGISDGRATLQAMQAAATAPQPTSRANPQRAIHSTVCLLLLPIRATLGPARLGRQEMCRIAGKTGARGARNVNKPARRRGSSRRRP
jgi:hypothetical protein